MSFIKNYKILNQKGIGLLQVVIVSGIIGIMGLAFVQMTDQQNKSLENSKTLFDLVSFTDQVRLSLSDSKACVDTFGSQSYSSPFTVNVINRSYIEPATQTKVTVPLATVNDQVAPNLKLIEIKLKSVDMIQQKAFAEITLERKDGSIVKREIQFIPLDPASTGKITTCFTSGTNVDDPEALCTTLGGAWDSIEKHCYGIVAVDPSGVFCKKFSKRELVQDATGRLQIKCQDCVAVDKFDHWACEHYPGKSSYSNLCYYRKICQSSQGDLMRPALWDGNKGPTHASGGDNASASNCRSDRKLCAGEPPGMSEHQVNP